MKMSTEADVLDEIDSGLEEPALVLQEVEWGTYVELRDNPSNNHIRMNYLDGALTLMAPEYIHEDRSGSLFLLVTTVAVALDIDFRHTGMTTLRRKGKAARKGAGKEPDQGFYLGDQAAKMAGKKAVDLRIDPPPDLAIEVDNTRDSRDAMETYARIRVPEVWIYRAHADSLRFWRLVGDGYAEIDRSLGLPGLTPALVLQALEAQSEMPMKRWIPWVGDWARRLPGPPAP